MDADYFWRNFWTEFAHLGKEAPNRKKALDMMREDVKKSVHAQFTNLHSFTAQHAAVTACFFKEYPAFLGMRVQETEDWWDRIAGGWSPDKIAVEQPGQADTSSIFFPTGR